MNLVIVEWLDSSARSGWRSRDYLQDAHPAKCVSVGIARSKEDCVNITQSISDAGDISEVVSIPRCSILRIRKLKV